MLNDIIVNNKLNLDKQFQIKFHSYNKRVINKKQKIGAGYYLTPNIDIAEKYTSYILFNKKKYKIALMAKVLISGNSVRLGVWPVSISLRARISPTWVSWTRRCGRC